MNGFQTLDQEISIDDWDALLSAVTSRLRQTVGGTFEHQPNGSAAALQATVLECVDALDQLHATLRTALPPPTPIDRDRVVPGMLAGAFTGTFTGGFTGTLSGDTPMQAVTPAGPDPAAPERP